MVCKKLKMICDYARQSIHVSALKKNIIHLRAICTLEESPLLSANERQKQVSRDRPTKRLRNHALNHIYSSLQLLYETLSKIRSDCMYEFLLVIQDLITHGCPQKGKKKKNPHTLSSVAHILTGTLSLCLSAHTHIYKPIYYNRKLKHS